MPTLPSHGIAALATLAGFERGPARQRLAFAGMVCAMLPDVDVVGFRLGVRYEDLLGHRGLTHSIVCAAAVATVVAWTAFADLGRFRAWWCLFVCGCSHGLLDAATNGGLGVALFAPFNSTRYFWPIRPIEVSPIGLTRILSARGVTVFLSELRWIWLPSVAVILLGHLRHRARVREAVRSAV